MFNSILILCMDNLGSNQVESGTEWYQQSYSADFFVG